MIEGRVLTYPPTYTSVGYEDSIFHPKILLSIMRGSVTKEFLSNSEKTKFMKLGFIRRRDRLLLENWNDDDVYIRVIFIRFVFSETPCVIGQSRMCL